MKFLWHSSAVGVATLIFGAIYYLFIYEPPVDEELVALAEELEKRVKAHKDVLDPSTCTWQEYYAYKGWDPDTGAPYEKKEESQAAKSEKAEENKTAASQQEKTEESKTNSKTANSKGKKNAARKLNSKLSKSKQSLNSKG